MAKFDPIIQVVDDGYEIPEIGGWGILKYNLVGAYCDIFSSSMKNKWEKLVYIDLFSGAGYAKVRDVEQFVQTSSLIAMTVPYPFSHYILSEYEPEKVEALKFRINKHHPSTSVSYYQGDTNKNIDAIYEELLQIHSRYRTLCFCFVDPFSLNLEFNTIKKIAAFNIDFLILLAIHMDFNRNVPAYFNPSNHKIERFTNNPNWRTDLEKRPDKQNIINFLSSEYDRNMLSLGYKKPPEKQQFKTGNTNIPLYHLAFYSRHDLGNEFFNKVRHHGQNRQLNLPF